MGCWIVVYTPQLYENYRLQSGEGMSILFLFGWIMGDVCSISGAILGGLVPSVIWLTSYHLLSDLLLLGQIYYYRWKRSRWPIAKGFGDSTIEEVDTLFRVIVRLMSYMILISLLGIAAWWVDEWLTGEWLREPIVQVLGWTSAVIFITSNLPQIVKNLETRCEGLAPGLFVFTSFGSCTYVLSICAKSTEKDYLATNAGWLAGHGVSALLDLAVCV
ncbi:putative vacuolar amino acid transporter YPQ3 [Leucoagaricus sp. SymC.cos]|nr:putative vacuolar amino acid transporter YPQ3 [Leucoagaricus sp. SymC.cos]